MGRKAGGDIAKNLFGLTDIAFAESATSFIHSDICFHRRRDVTRDRKYTEWQLLDLSIIDEDREDVFALGRQRDVLHVRDEVEVHGLVGMKQIGSHSKRRSNWPYD